MFANNVKLSLSFVVYFFTTLLFVFISFFYYKLNDSFFIDAKFDVIIYLCIVLMQIYFLNKSAFDRRLVSPVNFFILSYCIFFSARAWVYLFVSEDIIQAGFDSSLEKQVSVFYLSLMYFSIFSLFFLLNNKIRFYCFFSMDLEGFLLKNNFIALVFLFFGFVFLSFFLFDSYALIAVINSHSYLEIAGTDITQEHIKWFFFGKWLIILYLFFSGSNYKFLVAVSIIFLSSIGFLFIGLRGYSIAYIFLLIYFFSDRYRISYVLLFAIGFSILYVAAFVIEYRLGFSLYSGVYDMIIKTFHQQGATLEVLYGVYVYPELVASCVEVEGYFSKTTDFGRCVDRSRGIDWEYGGFATTVFAEIHYFGFIVATLIAYLFSIFLCLLDQVSYRFSLSVSKIKTTVYGVFMFMLIPNLVYFARSNAFDFIYKSIITIFFMILFFIFCFVAKKLLPLKSF